MSNWGAPVWYDDDDPEALLKAFVKISAMYKTQPPMAVGVYVFEKAGARDADLRGKQAGLWWNGQLDVLERIRVAIQNGGKEPEEFTKQQWEIELLALARDIDMSPTTKKAKVDAYKAIAEAKGWLVKPGEAGANDPKAGRLPRVVIARYAD